MARSKSKKSAHTAPEIRSILLKASRVHYWYLAVYIISIILFDAWNLISHESVLQRWTAAGSLLIINTIIWYLCKIKINNRSLYKILLLVLICCDILFASANIYWQRGMASKAVMLYLMPILTAGLIKRRSLIIATAAISAFAYSIASVRYFYDNYGQGYRVELYGETFMYSALFFVFAYLLMTYFSKSK